MTGNNVDESKPGPSTTRSNRDRAMIILGVALIALFLAAGYFSLEALEKKASPTLHGPAREPGHSSLEWDRFRDAGTFALSGLCPAANGWGWTELSIENRRSSIG